MHGDATPIPIVTRRRARTDGLPEGGVTDPDTVRGEVSPETADLYEGALKGREEVGAEEVGGAAVGAEVERLITAGAGRGGGGRGAVGEEDAHVLGAARAVGLRADAPRLRIVSGGGRGRAAPGGGRGALPLAPVLEEPVRWRGRRAGRGALGCGESGGGARGCSAEAPPPEEAGHGGGEEGVRSCGLGE